MARKSVAEQQDRMDVDLEKRILTVLEDIRYGTLTIIVQDGKVVQIDKNVKTRLI